MMQKNIILITIVLLLVVIIGGCIQKTEKEPLPETDKSIPSDKVTIEKTEKEPLPETDKSIPSDKVTIEKTALLSFTEFFCFLTEHSKPVAYFQFAYQENGEIRYVRTKTTCDDLIKIGASNDASKNPTIFGEQIKLHYKGGKPVKIARENGDIYEIEQSEQIRSFFTSGINKYENLKYFRNSNSDKVIDECLLIKDDNQHDRCLSFQAAFQQNINVCDKIIILSNQDLCKEWVNNIKKGSINK